MSEATAADQLSDQVFTLRAQVAALREALQHAEPWVESGPAGSWRDGVMAEIRAALEMSGGVK